MLVAAIEVHVPERVVARTAIGDFQSMIGPKSRTKPALCERCTGLVEELLEGRR